MSHKNKADKEHKEAHSHLTIVEAVENLSNLAEMDGKDRLGVIEDHLIVHEPTDEDEGFEAIQWLEEKSQHQTEEVVSDTFNAVLKYVKDFHNKEFNRFYEPKNQEGLKKIMVLVGKASDNLKNFTHLFEGSHEKGIEETKAYKMLDSFYKERIAIQEEDKVSLIDLSRKELFGNVQKHPLQEEDENEKLSKQFLFDVDKIKNDDFYELLYIQRDDGSRFFSSNFYRNLKLACNLTDFPNKNIERDPLEGVKCWLDRSLQMSSKKIMQLIRPQLKNFYEESYKYKDMDVVSSVNMALMALMMASNPKNKLDLQPIKSSKEYYQDFQRYLRDALNSFEYHKLRSVPPPASNVFLHHLMNIIHLMAWGNFFKHLDTEGFGRVIDDIIEEGRVSVSKSKKLSKAVNEWDQIQEHYLHISRYMLSYPLGPLFETLESMQEGDIEEFDVMMMNNNPIEWSVLHLDKKSVSMLRLPSPTRQEIINKVRVCGEFIGLLDAYQTSKEPKKHLLINLQDRTSWLESPRALELEKVPYKGDYYQNIDVVTLCKSSDFYWQKGAYKDLNSVQHFFKQIVLQLHSPETGFYFPKWIEEKVFNGFVEKLIAQIHRFFFDSKSKLTQEERCDFIEIFYQFLSLKLLEITQADSFSFSCKDALDVGSTSSASFIAFIKRLSGAKLSDKDWQQMQMILFAHAIIVRQRCPKLEAFQRFINCQKRIDKGIAKHSSPKALKKYFGDLFEFSFEKLNFNEMSLNQSIEAA